MSESTQSFGPWANRQCAAAERKSQGQASDKTIAPLLIEQLQHQLLDRYHFTWSQYGPVSRPHASGPRGEPARGLDARSVGPRGGVDEAPTADRRLGLHLKSTIHVPGGPRLVWVSMMKLAFRGNDETCGMIDYLSDRIDSIAKRRNDTIHRLWYIGVDDDRGIKAKLDYRAVPKGEGESE